MRIETERLILRRPTKKDVKDLVEGLNTLKISASLGFIPYPYTKKDAIKWVKACSKENKKKKKKEYNFAIELKSEKKLVGVVMLDYVDYFHRSARLGYWINVDYWGKGIVTEANKAVLDFVFNNLNLRRVHLGSYTEEEAAKKIPKKLGFKFEGTLRQSHKTKATGKIHDVHTYGLLKEDL